MWSITDNANPIKYIIQKRYADPIETSLDFTFISCLYGACADYLFDPLFVLRPCSQSLLYNLWPFNEFLDLVIGNLKAEIKVKIHFSITPFSQFHIPLEIKTKIRFRIIYWQK